MRFVRDQFLDDEHWRVHKSVISLEGVRAYDVVEERGGSLLIFYAIGLHDHKFMIRYGNQGPGDVDLYYLHASFDFLKTLKELTKLRNPI